MLRRQLLAFPPSKCHSDKCSPAASDRKSSLPVPLIHGFFILQTMSMLSDLLAFLEIDSLAVAGMALWALALYLGFYSVSQWLVEQLLRWFNFAERSLYLSRQEYERTRRGREAQNAFWAAIFSIFPFLLCGCVCYYTLLLGLGQSWAISTGLIAAISSGVYELGRRNGHSER